VSSATLVAAAARAVVQLAAVSLVIAAALESVWWSMAVVLVMYLVAVGTSGRRMNMMPTQWPWWAQRSPPAWCRCSC